MADSKDIRRSIEAAAEEKARNIEKEREYQERLDVANEDLETAKGKVGSLEGSVQQARSQGRESDGAILTGIDDFIASRRKEVTAALKVARQGDVAEGTRLYLGMPEASQEMIVDNHPIDIAVDFEGVYGIPRRDSRHLWNRRLGDCYSGWDRDRASTVVGSLPKVAAWGDRVYVATDRMDILDRNTGEQLDHFPIQGLVFAITAGSQGVYFADPDGIQRFDPHERAQELVSAGHYHALAFGRDRLFAASLDGVKVFDGSNQVSRNYAVVGGLCSPPGENVVYALPDLKGRMTGGAQITRIDLDKGMDWSEKMRGPVSVAAADEHGLYVVSGNGEIRFFDGPTGGNIRVDHYSGNTPITSLNPRASHLLVTQSDWGPEGFSQHIPVHVPRW